MAWWHGNLQNLTGHVKLRESLFKTVWLQNHLVGYICAAKVKVYGLFRFLCINLAYSDHTTFLQEQGQWISIAIVAHPQGGAHTLRVKLKIIFNSFSKTKDWIIIVTHTWDCASPKDSKAVQKNG